MFRLFITKADKRKSDESGFTLIELAGAVGGGILFLALASFGVLRALDNNRYSSLTRMIGNDVPAAIINISSTTGTLTSLAANAAGKNILVGMGLKPTTPWNTAWAVQGAGTANTVQLRFPLAGAQAATKGPTLGTTLAVEYPIISAAAFAGVNLDVTYNVLQ